MTIHVYFIDGRPPRRLYNIDALRDKGNNTIAAVNTFTGEPTIFEGVQEVAVSPELPFIDTEDEE